MSVKLKRLAKKSLSGLFPLSNEQAVTSVNATACQQGETEPSLEEFGKFEHSLDKDSPSRRLRLMGSLRKLKSSFDLSKTASCNEPQQLVENTPSKPERPRPSLMLDFEISPCGKSMFGPEHTKPSSSSVDVHRSSPMTIPTSAGEGDFAHGTVTPPTASSFSVGTIPRSPAPLQKASVQESILNDSRRKLYPSPVLSCIRSNPIPTPMPGTHFSLQLDQPPEIVVSPASPTSKEPPEYFPTTEDHHSAKVVPTDLQEIVCPQHFRTDTSIGALANCTGGKTSDSSLPEHLQDSEYTPTCTCFLTTKTGEGTRASEDDTINLLENHADVSAFLAMSAAHEDHEMSSGPNRRRGTWSRHTGLYDGTGYDFGDEIIADTPTSHNKGLSAAEEERAHIITEAIERSIRDIDDASKTPLPRASDTENIDDQIARVIASDIKNSLQDADVEIEVNFDTEAPAILEPESPLIECEEESIDDREALQEIIRAYAFPPDMVEGETQMEQTRELDDADWEDDEARVYEWPEVMIEVERDVKMSHRIMNRSLGG